MIKVNEVGCQGCLHLVRSDSKIGFGCGHPSSGEDSPVTLMSMRKFGAKCSPDRNLFEEAKCGTKK